MLEPQKPTGPDGGLDPNSAKPLKDNNPTPAENLPDFEPGTQDPNNPDKK